LTTYLPLGLNSYPKKLKRRKEMMSDSYTNRDVVERLDQLIAIMKLAYKDQLDT